MKSFRFSCLSRHLSLAAGVAAISGVVLSLGGVRVAWGQGPFTAIGIPPIAVAPRAQIDDLSTGVKSHLSRVDAFLADKQYDEAIHGLRQIMEEHADGLVEDVDPGDGAQQDRGPASIRKYIPLRRWCQKKLLSLADTHPDALDLYRRRVDPAAQQWFEQGVRNRDRSALRRVTSELFASSYGERAAWLEAQWALERGEIGRARRLMRRTRIGKKTAVDNVMWRQVLIQGEEVGTVAVEHGAGDRSEPPDINPADRQARLAWLSILEQSPRRARAEIKLLRTRHPDATGRFGGLTTDLAATLERQLVASEQWPPFVNAGWGMFAGDQARNACKPRRFDISGGARWRAGLPTVEIDMDTNVALALGARAAAEGKFALAYHPVVSRGKVFWTDGRHISAASLEHGTPVWQEGGSPLPQDRANGPQGPLRRTAKDLYIYRPERFPDPAPSSRVGVPRYTLTVSDGKLFARIGSPVAVFPVGLDVPPGDPGVIVGLDLSAQGRLLRGFPLRPDSSHWAFEGAPVVSGDRLLVVMKRRDVQPQLHVGCYQISTGRRVWRRKICAADSLGRGLVAEISHTLLSLDEDSVYVNTNMGAIAAVEIADGTIRWLVSYERSPQSASKFGSPSGRPWLRDLNPCLVDRSVVYAAPADSGSVFALDAGTGELLWQTAEDAPIAADAVQLVGATEEWLIAAGDRLWWIDTLRGELVAQFPQAASSSPLRMAPSPRGHGRGLIAGDCVYWPTREAIYVFDVEPRKTQRGGVAQLARQPVHLEPRGLSGGNLAWTDGTLLITGENEITAVESPAVVPRQRVQNRGR